MQKYPFPKLTKSEKHVYQLIKENQGITSRKLNNQYGPIKNINAYLRLLRILGLAVNSKRKWYVLDEPTAPERYDNVKALENYFLENPSETFSADHLYAHIERERTIGYIAIRVLLQDGFIQKVGTSKYRLSKKRRTRLRQDRNSELLDEISSIRRKLGRLKSLIELDARPA